MNTLSKPELLGKARIHYQKVKDLIRYCTYDQPYDRNEVIWLYGQKRELIDLFNDYKIPKTYHADIAARMVCKSCGNNDFEIHSYIGAEEEKDNQIHIKLGEADRKFKKKIIDLQEYIKLYPSLVLDNPLARKIQKEIESGNLQTCVLEKFDCYRSRIVGDAKVFNSIDLGAPDVGIARIGRYNHPGQSVLYVSESRDCSVAEILDDYHQPALIWVQKYHIDGITNILDLKIDWGGFLNFGSVLFTALLNNNVLERRISKDNSTWKPGYLLTNFVADCAKKANYNGIKYNSSKYRESNIVLFDPKHKSIQPVDKPDVFIHDPKPPAVIRPPMNRSDNSDL